MVSRRDLIRGVLVGGSAGLAGCGMLSGSSGTDTTEESQQAAQIERAGRDTKATMSEITDQLNEQAEQAKSYRSSIPANWPSEETFSYERFDQSDLDLWLADRVIAETGVDGNADRLFLLPNEMEAVETAMSLRSQWGVPDENTLSISLDGSQVSLIGGEGISIWGFVGTSSVNGSDWVIAVRGSSEESVRRVADSISADSLQ